MLFFKNQSTRCGFRRLDFQVDEQHDFEDACNGHGKFGGWTLPARRGACPCQWFFCPSRETDLSVIWRPEAARRPRTGPYGSRAQPGNSLWKHAWMSGAPDGRSVDKPACSGAEERPAASNRAAVT